jgi:conjugative transfer signal peptidase TraF
MTANSNQAVTGRTRVLLTLSAGLALLALPSFISTPPRLIWNASASVPIGLYLVRPARFERGELAAVKPPITWQRWMTVRGYLGADALLMKYVAATSGQTVCRNGLRITIDNRPVATARDRDTRGRTLPVWRGCHRLSTPELFFLNAQARLSLDGRYFGPWPRSLVVGRAVPLWIERAAS